MDRCYPFTFIVIGLYEDEATEDVHNFYTDVKRENDKMSGIRQERMLLPMNDENEGVMMRCYFHCFTVAILMTITQQRKLNQYQIWLII